MCRKKTLIKRKVASEFDAHKPDNESGVFLGCFINQLKTLNPIHLSFPYWCSPRLHPGTLSIMCLSTLLAIHSLGLMLRFTVMLMRPHSISAKATFRFSVLLLQTTWIKSMLTSFQISQTLQWNLLTGAKSILFKSDVLSADSDSAPASPSHQVWVWVSPLITHHFSPISGTSLRLRIYTYMILISSIPSLLLLLLLSVYSSLWSLATVITFYSA